MFLYRRAKRKIVIKEHGYAKIQSSSVETFVELKAQKNKEMKKIVALEAFNRIENGMTVYLDSGSTILTAISALRNVTSPLSPTLFL